MSETYTCSCCGIETDSLFGGECIRKCSDFVRMEDVQELIKHLENMAEKESAGEEWALEYAATELRAISNKE